MGILDRFKKNKLVEKATDTVGDVAEKVGDVAGDVADKAGDMAGKVGEKAGDVAGKVGDAVADGVDKATDFIDDKTGGKIHDQLEKVDNVADKLRSDDEDGGEGDSEEE